MAGHLKDSALQSILRMFIVKHRKDTDVTSWQDPRPVLYNNRYGFFCFVLCVWFGGFF